MIKICHFRSDENENYYMIGDDETIFFMYLFDYGQNQINSVDMPWSQWKDRLIKYIPLSEIPVHGMIMAIFKDFTS